MDICSKARAQLEGPNVAARLAIPALGIDATLTTGADGWAEITLDAAPELWSPASPRLDDVSLSYGDNLVRDRVGFREVRRAGRDILLNGQPIFLRGISVHEDDETLGKAFDPTRLVSAACLVNHVRFRIEDRLAAVIDVIGINEYIGWYFPDYEELIAIGRNSNPDRPVVISETGADGVREGGPKAGFFSQDYMSEVYRRQIDILGRLDYIRGMSPWILYDFRAEKRMNRYQRGWNRKGLIAQDKATKKDAFAILAAHYHALAARNRA